MLNYHAVVLLADSLAHRVGLVSEILHQVTVMNAASLGHTRMLTTD